MSPGSTSRRAAPSARVRASSDPLSAISMQDSVYPFSIRNAAWVVKPSSTSPARAERACHDGGSPEESREILRYHHERVDGSGYPDGLRGDEIPVYAKIVGLVDVLDAITSVKVYNRPMNPYHAMRYLAVNSGVKFDRSLIKRFWQLMGYYPEGTRLYLTNRCDGVVTRRGRFTPEVRVIREGDDSVPETPYLIDLGVNRNVGIYRIDLEGETATG